MASACVSSAHAAYVRHPGNRTKASGRWLGVGGAEDLAAQEHSEGRGTHDRQYSAGTAVYRASGRGGETAGDAVCATAVRTDTRTLDMGRTWVNSLSHVARGSYSMHTVLVQYILYSCIRDRSWDRSVATSLSLGGHQVSAKQRELCASCVGLFFCLNARKCRRLDSRE